MSSNLVDPTTGEMMKPTPSNLRKLWELEKAVRKEKDKAKKAVAEFLGDDNEYRFEDGARFVKVRREDKIIPVSHAYSIVDDQEAFISLLRDNAINRTKLSDMVKSGVITKDEQKKLKAGEIIATNNKGEPSVTDYVKLEVA